MASHSEIIARWVRDVRADDPKFLSDTRANVKVRQLHPAKHAAIYSWGEHFEMARWVPETDQHTGFWLLNGDTYSNSTTRHQSGVRSAVQRRAAKDGEPVVILPYTPLESAGIDLSSIVPVEITADRWEPVTYRTAADIPGYIGDSVRADPAGSYYIESGNVIANPDGTFTVVQGRHVLGEALIRATFTTGDRWTPDSERVTATGYFLSAFDHQERTRHYFLAQLPAGAAPTTVAEAFEALRPPVVKLADRAGLPVTRQGDVFAVPTEFTTRDLHAHAPTVKGAALLGLSHVATETITLPGDVTYARGILTHRPTDIDPRTGQPRRPEHRRQPMGDRKTWHLIVKNTVPTDDRGESRAWSQVGNVD